MAPIRTALIGLSASAKTSWASGAHLPYLLSPRGKERYQIVALLNSSVDAARAAIDTYGLGSDTKAYGSPEDLASDPDVDLVVCCTRVDVHYDTIKPSIAAGKAVFVEWPLAQDVAHARELTALAKEKGARSVIGLQGRLAPAVSKIKELIAWGRIGKVLSAEVRGYGGTNSRDIIPKGIDYFMKREVGGNIYTVGFAHLFDWVKSTVGQTAGAQGHFQLQRPENKVRDSSGNIIATARSNVPDLITVTATLDGSPTVQTGASLLARFRRGQPFPGELPLWLTINGEKGEIRLTNSAGTSLHSSADTEALKVELHDFETDKVERVEWDWSEWQKDLPVWARSIGSLFEEFAKGSEGDYPTFEDALALHEQLESLIASFSA
ncbi:NAD(P)-binding protein [Coniochaeta ligniaria NRRL 30616]|uniref:NAD(P)-binding protein n=1 Tax=Coniochaeta ligniaria NRRL 30616 TaxID=1408157 RepID=A0A1J7ID86_9PEZI|nr:NAD(P)-binding protein [Coniochaeta ligniaria NRRL 30616]